MDTQSSPESSGPGAIDPTHRIKLIYGGAGILLGSILTLLFQHGCTTEVPEMALVRSSSGSVHSAIAGRPVIVKAVLKPQPGRLLKYSWKFGDGSDPVEGMVTNPYAVDAIHTYKDAKVGSKYTAELTLTDVQSGEKTKGNYRVEFVEATTQNKAEVSLDDALWVLHSQMERRNDPVYGPIGIWNTRYYPAGSTAMAALAFAVNGYDGRADRSDTPYRETLDRALNYIISTLTVVKLENEFAKYDSDGNGIAIGIGGSKQMYEHPLIAMTLIATRDRDRVATTGPEGVIGRPYEEIVVDMLDYLAYGQVVREGSVGGWRYTPRTYSADMSVTQWPILAFMAAEVVWDIEAPNAVKNQLREYIKNSQDEVGGFTYQAGDGYDRVGLTGAGLIALAFLGEKGDPRKKAESYIATNWADKNVGDYYAMYAVMKGAKLSEPRITKFGEHDWYTQYVDHLFTNQNENGTWNEDGNYAKGHMATAWPALVLSQDIFAKADPLTLFWKIVMGVGIAIPIILAILAVLYFLKKRGNGAEADPAPES